MATAASPGWAWLDEVLISSGTFVDEPGFVDLLDAAEALDTIADADLADGTTGDNSPSPVSPSAVDDPFGWDDGGTDLRGVFEDAIAGSDDGIDDGIDLVEDPPRLSGAAPATPIDDVMGAFTGDAPATFDPLGAADPFGTVDQMDENDGTNGDLGDFDDDGPGRNSDDLDGF